MAYLCHVDIRKGRRSSAKEAGDKSQVFSGVAQFNDLLSVCATAVNTSTLQCTAIVSVEISPRPYVSLARIRDRSVPADIYPDPVDTSISANPRRVDVFTSSSAVVSSDSRKTCVLAVYRCAGEKTHTRSSHNTDVACVNTRTSHLTEVII